MLEVPVYRWLPAEDLGPLPVPGGPAGRPSVDAVVFTSAPAVVSLLATAEEEGRREAVLDALRGPVLSPASAR